MMKYLFSLLASVFLLAVSALGGTIVALETDIPDRAYKYASYTLRTALGLEKSWGEVPGAAQALGREPVSCPDPSEAVVLVTGGQSNAANVIPARHVARNEVSVWFAGTCYRGDDPLLGARGRNGSLWSLLGDRLAGNLGRPVLLINGAIGGTQFADWLDPRSGYYAALSARISSARAAGYRPDLVLWHQGETDAAVVRDLAVLEGEMTALMDRLAQEAPSAPIYMFRATRCVGAGRDDGVPPVNAAQRRVAERHERVIPGLDTDTLGRDYRWDTCHFNSYGRAEIVERIAPDLARLIRRGEDPAPLVAERSGDEGTAAPARN